MEAGRTHPIFLRVTSPHPWEYTVVHKIETKFNVTKEYRRKLGLIEKINVIFLGPLMQLTITLLVDALVAVLV